MSFVFHREPRPVWVVEVKGKEGKEREGKKGRDGKGTEEGKGKGERKGKREGKDKGKEQTTKPTLFFIARNPLIMCFQCTKKWPHCTNVFFSLAFRCLV